MNFYEEWAEMHANECDEEYQEYHQKTKDALGYIPKENFFYDGILFEEDYKNADKKILFIAKECNAYYDNTTIKTEIITSNYMYWARVEVEGIIAGKKSATVFLRGLAMLDNAIISNDFSHPNKDVSVLKNAALINLNKRGGYNYCVWNTLEGYVKKYQDKLREQIKTINPNIIVCCGESVYALVTKYDLAPNIEKEKIKCAFHPSYFSISDKDKLRFLETGKKPNKSKIKNESEQTEKEEIKGLILDTNNRWSNENEKEMMVNSRACAYGDSRRQLRRFNPNDYVLFYSTNKKGIIAIGQVNEPDEEDKTDTSWWTVTPLVPNSFDDAINTEKFLPLSKLREILYGDERAKMPMRGTVKNKKINKDEVKSIIKALRSEYDKSE